MDVPSPPFTFNTANLLRAFGSTFWGSWSYGMIWSGAGDLIRSQSLSPINRTQNPISQPHEMTPLPYRRCVWAENKGMKPNKKKGLTIPDCALSRRDILWKGRRKLAFPGRMPKNIEYIEWVGLAWCMRLDLEGTLGELTFRATGSEIDVTSLFTSFLIVFVATPVVALLKCY